MGTPVGASQGKGRVRPSTTFFLFPQPIYGKMCLGQVRGQPLASKLEGQEEGSPSHHLSRAELLAGGMIPW
jgi:hypothetical protein